MGPQSSSTGSIWPFKRPWLLYAFAVTFTVFYIIFIIDEAFPVKIEDFEDLSVILLFLFYVAGFILSWFREKTAGYMFISWFIIEVFLGNFVWEDAALVLILGFPLLPIGIFYVLYANKKGRDPRPSAHEQCILFLRLSILAGVAIHIIVVVADLLKLPPDRWVSGPYLYLNLLFIVFLAAAAFSRKNKLITGLLLVTYYLAIIYLMEVGIIDEIGPFEHLTFPVLVLGLLYLVYWIYIRPRKAVEDG